MKTLFASICAAALFAQPASATLITFNANFSGSQQATANPSFGTGAATLVADTVGQTLKVSESFTNLSAGSVAGHLHVGKFGMSGPVIIPFTNFPVGVTSGSYTGTFTAANLINQTTSGVATFAELLTALTSNNAYLNIHSSLYPAGEIRGQVAATSVPEPMTLIVLGSGLAAMALARRRLALSRV